MTTVMAHTTAPFPVATETCNFEENFSDFDKLKELSEKLQLTTRRPSVVQWKQIIEYRKSRGQYVTAPKQKQNSGPAARPEICKHLDQRQETEQIKSSSEKPSKEMTSSDLHRTLFEDNQDTPTKMTSQGPMSTTPTPTRRFRRIGRCIPELNEDITNNDDQQVTLIPKDASSQGGDVTNNDTSARYRKVSQMLEQLRTDLMIMRIEDNKLARKLLDVRSDLNLVRAQQSCQEHAEMIDDVTYEMEEEEEITGLIKACDLPDHRPGSLLSAFSPLRHIGLSRMNLNRRRFSIR
uniref:Uncharacterized protein LOC100183949 n=1 Tax=Phallusia mammillata TaxID=59560 RepID=A0A6F9DIV3_9ASCI|nr:uncharacterized protein LOC100183949 [Phallusia mammillata]